MNPLKKYIFYSICEKSYELFKETNYMTYLNFCNGLKISIENDMMDSEDAAKIVYILEYLKKIYGMEYTESGAYVKEFFVEEKYKNFEIPIKLVEEYFNNSLN